MTDAFDKWLDELASTITPAVADLLHNGPIAKRMNEEANGDTPDQAQGCTA